MKIPLSGPSLVGSVLSVKQWIQCHLLEKEKIFLKKENRKNKGVKFFHVPVKSDLKIIFRNDWLYWR